MPGESNYRTRNQKKQIRAGQRVWRGGTTHYVNRGKKMVVQSAHRHEREKGILKKWWEHEDPVCDMTRGGRWFCTAHNTRTQKKMRPQY